MSSVVAHLNDNFDRDFPRFPRPVQEELEKVQNCAARSVTRNYIYETGKLKLVLFIMNAFQNHLRKRTAKANA